jgi:serine/threonine protein kinase/predicted Zn-dependent protease
MAAEDSGLASLIETLRADQCRHWLRGERFLTENYSSEHPEILGHPASALQLIYNEMLLREGDGENPNVDEYIARFPGFADDLKALFEVHQALESDQLLSVSATTNASALSTWSQGEAPASGPWPQIAGYEILAEVGHGGMGVIYKARQVGLNRIVALKMILTGHHANPAQLARFRAEAEAVARLQHPNIVQVHEVGDQDGRPYFSMEFVNGGSLAQALNNTPQSAIPAANLVKTLARAIQVAHERGIIHRDLKPANILIQRSEVRSRRSEVRGQEAEVRGQKVEVQGQHSELRNQSSDGLRKVTPFADLCSQTSDLWTPTSDLCPKITDFGLAKHLDVDATQTGSGLILGTPSYMAPEQADGKGRAIGPATDIYALGAVLYELLAGRPPFKASTQLETLRLVLSEEPTSLTHLHLTVPRDLETICLKCLEKDPSRRYGSALALAEDLERFLTDRPILARRTPVLERAWRSCRRNPLAASLGVVIGVLVTSSVVSLMLLYLNANGQRVRAEGAEENWRLAAIAARDDELKARQAEEDTRDVLNFFEERVLAASRPKGRWGGLGTETPIRAAVEKAEPEIARTFGQRPLVEASLRETIGKTYLSLRQLPQAIDQHKRVLALRQSVLPPDDLKVVGAQGNLVQDYLETGQPDLALPLAEQALKLYQEKLGPDDLKTLIARSLLAQCLVAVGRAGEALPLHEEAFRRSEAVLGPDALDTILFMENLGRAYLDVGKRRESLPLLERSLESLRTKLGPDNPDTIATGHSLAQAYWAEGRFPEALQLYEEVLKQSRSILGPDHPETLRSMNNLGAVYRHAGRLPDAVKLFEEVVELRKTRSGPDHPETLNAMGNLATVYLDSDRPSDALPLHQTVLEREEAKLGRDHPQRLTYMNSTANCLIKLKKYTEAETLLRECLALRLKKDPENWGVALTKMQLGQSLMKLNRFVDAEPLLSEAYLGMVERKGQIPANPDYYVRRAVQLNVDLYDAWGKTAQASEWRQKLGPPDKPKP